MAWKGRNLFDFFPDSTTDEVLNAFNYLSDKSKGNLMRAFGEKLDRRDIWFTLLPSDRRKINSIINITLKNKIERLENGEKLNKKGVKRTKEVKKNKFTREKEIEMIKRAKLSFYDKVSDDLKDLYFKYYCEVFPVFKNSFDKASSSDKKILLEEAIENSKRWRDLFIEQNQGLVGYIAGNFHAVSRDDAMQEGNIGMLVALKKFDLEKGLKFSSYAFYWIRRYIIKYNNWNDSIVRKPDSTGTLFNKLKQEQANYYQKHHCFPDDDLLSEIAGCSLYMVKQFRYYTEYIENPVQIDAPISDNNKRTIENIVEDVQLNFDDDVENSLITESIIDWVSNNIDDKSKYILIRKYGLDGEGRHTNKEIAKELGISTQRVFYINERTLKSIQKFSEGSEGTLEKCRDLLSFKILKLHYILNMSYDKISDDLGMDLNEVLELSKCALVKLKSKYDYKNGKIIKKRGIK